MPLRPMTWPPPAQSHSPLSSYRSPSPFFRSSAKLGRVRAQSRDLLLSLHPGGFDNFRPLVDLGFDIGGKFLRRAAEWVDPLGREGGADFCGLDRRVGAA